MPDINSMNKNLRAGLRNLQYFDGFLENHYKDRFINGYAFAFITKPKLFLNPYKPISATENPNDYIAYNNMCSDPFFTLFISGEEFNEQDKEIIYNLSYKSDDPMYNARKSNFIKIFTNEFKNFDPIDVNLDTNTDAFSTKQGYTMPLPTHTSVSHGTGLLSFQFDETLNMDMTKLFTLWTKYIENISDGTFRANPDMIQAGELDYMSSIYYFVLGPDGKEIKYWCRYTGCYPTSIPYGAYNFSRGDKTITSITVPITYVLKEDMNPRILEDFNRVALDQLYTETVSEHSEFQSYKESDLLSLNKLLNGNLSNLVNIEDRDPIVFFNEKISSTGYHYDSFELSFSKTDIENPYYINHYEQYDYDLYKNKI